MMTKVKFLILFVFIVSLSLNAQLVGPKISSNESAFDFGVITEGQIVEHDFVVFNTGDDLLKIEKVRASCGCTAAQPDKTELKPGESATISVKFNSANRRGTQRKYVYVYCNDPENAIYKLSFSTFIQAEGDKTEKSGPQPKMLIGRNSYDFGTVKEGEVVKVTVNFKNAGNDKLIINNVRTSCGCTAALLSSKEIQPGEQGSLKIELDTSGRNGKFTRTITMFTNDPDHRQQTITLFANIVKG
ncbi:MAG: DUF1573 domain-containing protein [Melioribacteraceae bacterium]|nr:DUF1573 domain-containing protein [Melioribacteraceae bacterium]MCF8355383.1 DUF1573 domain-containing protein [Melioribacteraceae bacterium]MCF8394628.1 DUF1573 domain-containing protein [Melioribacteraceae bacterium]MCF8419625.1 DUF1573 domain-containing protein [Melioribacteraceae bacterium]